MTGGPPDATGRVRVSPGQRKGSIEVVLARADRRNAVDMAFAQSLQAAAAAVHVAVSSGAADCVVVSAQGQHFCVGGDLNDFPADEDRAVPHLQNMSFRVHEAMATFLELPVPIVSRVQGVAAGAGIGLAVFADVVVASTAARFRSAYTAMGLSPDCGTSWMLPRLIGERRAMDMVLTNRMVGAAEAEAWGLASRVVAPDRLDDTVDEVVAAILGAGRAANAASKRLLRSSLTDGLRAHLADEGQTVALLGGSAGALAARERFIKPDDVVGHL